MIYLLNGKRTQQVRLCKAVEVAFAHLQRQIAVDVCIGEENKYLCLKDRCVCTGNKWRKAFEKGEYACEKLGVVHLLSHKIWAFKALSVRAETDLVLYTLDFFRIFQRCQEWPSLSKRKWKGNNRMENDQRSKRP